MTAEGPGTMRQPGTHMCPHIWAGESDGGLAWNAGLSLSPLLLLFFPVDLNLGLSGECFLKPKCFSCSRGPPPPAPPGPWLSSGQ